MHSTRLTYILSAQNRFSVASRVMSLVPVSNLLLVLEYSHCAVDEGPDRRTQVIAHTGLPLDATESSCHAADPDRRPTSSLAG